MRVLLASGLNWSIVREPTILVTSVVYGFLVALCVLAGIFGIWLGVLLLTSLWRYSYIVLRAVAQGHQRLPPPELDSMNPVGRWAEVWHFVFFPGAVLATAPYQPAGTIVAIVVAIMFPASAAVMGLTSSLSQAFNPEALIHFARTTRRDYWTLVIGYVTIFVGASLLIAVVLPAIGFFAIAASAIVAIWALFSSFALVGTVLRAHRLEFEIPGEVRPREEEMLERRHREWRGDLDIAYGSFRSGLLESGYKTLHKLVDANGDSVEINHWLIENMFEWEDKRFALEIAAKVIPRLLARGDRQDALELYQRCRRRNPEFRPAVADAQQLAAYAAEIGRTGLVAELGYNRESP